MAFNIKVSVVLLVMLVVATSADARADLSEVFAKPESAGAWPKYCTECECKKESGTTKCYRSEWKADAIAVPLACRLTGSPRICKSQRPPICGCTFQVETCTPEQCPQSTAPKLEDVLSLNRHY